MTKLETLLEEAHSALQHWEASDEETPDCVVEALESINAALEIVRGASEPEVRLTEMSLKAREGEPFEATGQFQGDAIKEWAVAMVQSFREKGGINYIACDLSDPTTGERYEITMQKAGGRTPAQDLAELRSQLNRNGDS